MSKPRYLILAAAISFFFNASVAQAGIYKCVSTDGELTYSQTPCPNQKSESIREAKSTSSETPIDCNHANRFALATAKTMRNGASSSELFSQYGGLDSLSKGSINIINYVYSHRSNSNVDEQRIAALAQAKCRAKSFGDVSCEALPFAFTEKLGGCDDDDEDDESRQTAGDAAVTAMSLEQQDSLALAGTASTQRSSATTQPDLNATSAARAEERRQKCLKSAEDKIDGINTQMRSGYSSSQGERYREQLRTLRRERREC